MSYTSFADNRTLMACALCGGATETQDHVPAKVLLDDPLPPDLAVVPACERCNNGLSKHEEYIAVAIDVALRGGTTASALRPKVAKVLAHSPALATRIASVQSEQSGVRVLGIEAERVAVVLTKLAKCHTLHELSEPNYEAPSSLWYAPLHTLDHAQRTAFEAAPVTTVWPEVGSRAMQRLAQHFAGGGEAWIVVQPGRYRFLAETGDGVRVRMVLSEYLAAEVAWR